MTRPGVLVLLAGFVLWRGMEPVAAAQALGTLHITVTLQDGGADRPVPRHALLISDEPATASPREVLTDVDGHVDVRLRAGQYVIESDRAAPSQGKSYQWRQTVTIAAGQDIVLALTSGNAEVSDRAASETAAPDAGSLFEQWRHSVVIVWGQTSKGLGFVIDRDGLIATSQQVVAGSESAQVQLLPAGTSTSVPAIKVAARIISADPVSGAAILSVDPAAIASIRPVRLAGESGGPFAVTSDEELFSVGSARNDRTFMTTATVSRLDPHEIDSDIIVDRGSAGAPVFGTDGEVVGIATLGPRRNDGASGVSGIARIDGAKDAIAKARTGISTARPPEGIHLPVEPARPFPLDALERVVAKRAGSLDPYPMAAADFDVSFITPVNTYGAQHLAEQTNTRARASRARGTAARAVRRPLDEFGNWTDYVAGFPAVLMIRATPKLVEGFWAAAGRAAAQTQGIGLPPTKHVKAPFASLRLYCGGAEVPPIHPFKIERHVVGRDGSENPRPVYEGLYVFAPDAVGPRCGTVKLVLFSERDPARGDAHVVDARIVEQIWQDFASYRDGK